MHILLRTSSSNENYNADCDLAFVTIEQQSAKDYVALMDLAKELKVREDAFVDARFWNYDARFTAFPEGADDGFDRVQAEAEAEDFACLPAPPDVKEDAWHRMDCSYIVASSDDLF